MEDDLVSENETHAIINLILRETEFLLDDKIMEEISQEGLKEQLLDKLNVLRKVLAIQNPNEMKRLIHTIFVRAKEEDHDNEGEDKAMDILEEEEMENIQELEDKYDKDQLVGILMSFIDEKKNHVVLNSSDLQKKKEFQKQEEDRKRLESQKFWENVTKVVPDETHQVWRVLDKISSKYYQLLLDRHKLIEETTELHNQNDELQNLLNQYLKVNHNLINSNTQNIKVNLLE